MLIDLKKWKDKKVGERCIQFLKDNAEANNIPDQNAINYVLKDDVELISLRYNVDGLMPYLPYKNAKKLFMPNNMKNMQSKHHLGLNLRKSRSAVMRYQK